MFIINQNGDKLEELKSLSKEYIFSDNGNKKLEKIYREYDNRIYRSYIPLLVCCETKLDRKWLEKKINECYLEHEHCHVLVNDYLFGDYKKDIGNKIFDDIICAIKQNKLVFDLRDYEKIN